MTLDECKKVFERVSEGAVFDCIDKESYFQFDIIGGDNSESNFYLKFKDGRMSVHEGDYKERDVMLIVTPATLDKIITGRLDPAYAYATRKIKMPGDANLGRMVLTMVAGEWKNRIAHR